LNEKGIPVPGELLETHKKDVYIFHHEEEVRGAIERNINSLGQVKVMGFDSGVDALMAMGRCMPSVIVWDASQKDISPAALLCQIRKTEQPHRVDMALIGDGESLMNSGLPDEMSEVPLFTYPDNFNDMIKWMRKRID